MPVIFNYWEHGDSVSVDAQNDAVLTTEEALVVATLKVAEETGAVANALKDILYYLQNHTDSVDE
jgi:hypothetical protein